jgi:outer membrane biosynthesis protein TonB
MDRAQATGFGVATAGHVALFAALSLSLAVTRLPPPQSPPMEVSFVKDVGPVNSAPQPTPTPPTPSAAPEAGPPEEAAPVPPPPAPAPPAPASTPAPPPPQKAVQAPQPRPVPKPAARQAPAKPAPPQAAATPAPVAAKPAPAKAAPTRTEGRSGTATASRGSRLSLDFLKGVGSDATPSSAQQAQASVMSAEALAGITAAIKRQIQPCANRQVNPGPDANQIRVKLNLHLNRDGSLAQRPTVVSTTGVTATNARYEDRVRDLAIAAYVGCSPLRDLPDNLYQTPKGGWANFNMTYNLP